MRNNVASRLSQLNSSLRVALFFKPTKKHLMPKYLIALKINVKKIDKARLYKGAKGTYLDATIVFDPDNPDQYDNHGFIAQSVRKEEREAGQRGEILGNGKLLKVLGDTNINGNNSPDAEPATDFEYDEDDLPF